MELDNGKPDCFLTREEQLHFRTLTLLLSLTSDFESRSRKIVPYATAHRRGTESLIYRLLGEFSDLLVREDEVIALSSSKKAPGLVKIIQEAWRAGSEDTEGKRNDKPAPATTAGREKLLGLALLVKIPKPSQKFPTESMSSFHAQHWNKTSTGRWATDVTFDEHCANLVHLLKDSHNASDTNDARGPKGRLTDYVILVSCDKMLKRVNLGRQKRNLYDYLTLKEDDIIKQCPRNAHNLVAQGRLIVNGQQRILSRNQFSIVHSIIIMMERDGFFANVEGSHSLAHLRRWALQKHSMDNRPEYDKKGRLHVQTILGYTLTQVQETLSRVEEAKGMLQELKEEDVEDRHGMDADELREEYVKFKRWLDHTVRRASCWMHTLTNFKTAFKDLLYDHLVWLQCLFMLGSTTKAF